MAYRGKLSWEVIQNLVSHNRQDRPHFEECRVSMEERGIPPTDNSYGVIEGE
jgi:hypothetical protein